MALNEHQMVEEYSLILLKWARRRVNNLEQAQELVQEVWMQFFVALYRERNLGREVGKPDHFLWKVAKYVWLGYLRRMQGARRRAALNEEMPVQEDFTADFADDEEKEQLLRFMRRRVVQLDSQQREILIFYYIDQLPQIEIARRLKISVSVVKWHLFNARKRLRKEFDTMLEQDFVYRPRKLHVACSGQSMIRPDIEGINDSLIRQNICLMCYEQPKNVSELSEKLGIPRAYIEDELDWLLEKEFLSREGNRYSTTFMIQSPQEEQDIFAVHMEHRETLCDVIADELLAAEQAIRAIGFHGSDQPMNRLLWLLIYRWCAHALNSLDEPLYVEPPIHCDGGKYFAWGFERGEPDRIALDTKDWAYNGSMYKDGLVWFGLYNFGESEIEDLINGDTCGWVQLRSLLRQIISQDGSVQNLDDDQRGNLAWLVSKNFLRMEGLRAVPNFCVLTQEQYRRLANEIFEPLRMKLQPELRKLYDDISACCAARLPKQLDYLRSIRIKNALADLGFISTIFSFERGLLYKPAGLSDGEFLTMGYVK